jgi:hypothetical protein
MMIVIVGIIATLIGLFGYSLIPEKRLDQEKHLSSIVNFYMVVCFSLFVHTYSLLFGINYMFLELFFAFSITVAAIYLLWSIVGFDRELDKKFDFFRLKNGILYASIVWLMGKELGFINPQTFLLPGLLLFPLFFALLYAFLVMKEMRLFFFYENTSVFSNSFLIVALSGIATISMSQAPAALIPIESIVVFIAFVVILRMFRAAKPFIG